VSKDVEALVTERLLALAAAHDLLTRGDWRGAELADVAQRAVRAYDQPGRMTLSGPKIQLEPRTAIALSMALHELATNAVKHGALSQASGHVDLSWSSDGETVILEWRESGGPFVQQPQETGFGSRLLGPVLAGELGRAAELVYAPEGLICRIYAPTAEADPAPAD
jgi:two-component sensor histidine kinase